MSEGILIGIGSIIGVRTATESSSRITSPMSNMKEVLKKYSSIKNEKNQYKWIYRLSYFIPSKSDDERRLSHQLCLVQIDRISSISIREFF